MTFNIDGYEVQYRKQLGRGHYGTVYLARDKDGLTIAAKEVDTSRSEVRELKNAQKHSRLNHENIVKILHIFNEENEEEGVMKKEVWVFMEYIKGGDLNQYSMNNFEDFQTNRTNIMIETAKGLSFLHKLKVAHRDIKPENILIESKQGLRPTVKLTDFGIAKFQDPGDKSTMHTKLGTRDYMAPEFFQMEIKYHKNVDIFALGLTFLAILNSEEGKPLKPLGKEQIDQLTKYEWHTPIGQVMTGRFGNKKPNLNIVPDKAEDDNDVLVLKKLIRQTTSFHAEDRPTAQQILETLEALADPQSKPCPSSNVTEEEVKEAHVEKQVRSFHTYIYWQKPVG